MEEPAPFGRATTARSLPEEALSRTTTRMTIPASEWGLELQEAAAPALDAASLAGGQARAVGKDAEARLLEQGLYSARLFGSALANPRLTLAQKIFVTLEVPTSSRLVSAGSRTHARRARAETAWTFASSRKIAPWRSKSRAEHRHTQARCISLVVMVCIVISTTTFLVTSLPEVLERATAAAARALPRMPRPTAKNRSTGSEKTPPLTYWSGFAWACSRWSTSSAWRPRRTSTSGS
jgi:hypothetical protein